MDHGPAKSDLRTKSNVTNRGTSVAEIPPDQIVFAQGDLCDAVFYLRSGTAKVHVLSKSGREAVILILGPGDFFGESAMLENARRVATVTTMTECTIERIEASEIKRRLRSDPAFFKVFMHFLVTRNRRYLTDVSDQHFYSTEKRLALTLLRLARTKPNGRSEAALPRLSQETLADMIGTTRSRVSYFMNKFRRQGLIEYDRHGHIRVRESLSNYSQED